MRKTFLLILASMLALGFLTGFLFGRHAGKEDQLQAQRLKSLNELRADLKESEQAQLLSLVDGSYNLRSVDEGGLFQKKIAYYLEGAISNGAAVSAIANIHLKVTFLSKAGLTVGQSDVVLNEIIQPNRELNFKQKVNWPSDVEKYSVNIVAVDSR